MPSSRRSLFTRFLPKKRVPIARPVKPERSFRPRVERLEDRLTPTTLNYLVNSLSPTAAHTATTGGIQDAVNAANADTTHTLFAITFSPTVFTGAAKTVQLAGLLDFQPTNHALVVTVDATSVGGVTLRGTGVASGSGAVEVDNGTVNLTDLTITNGHTNNSGGGLYNIATMTITNCTFTNDVAGEEGGGMENEDIMTVVGCTFTNDSANYGGGVYNDATMTISNSTISNNVLTGVGGGAGFGDEGAATLTNCTITGNVGSNSGDVGGGVLNFYTLSITGGTISGNSVGSNGGGIDDEGTGLLVANCTIGQNTAAGGGGVYSDAVTTISNSQLTGNVVTGTGGGVAITNAAVVSINNSTINGNFATGNGGGIVDLGAMTVTNSTVSGNSSAGSGGGIAAPGTAVAVLDSTLSGNSATGSGGGIFLGAHVQMVDSIVANSTHGGDLAGGAVIAGSGHDLIDDAATGSGLVNGVGGNIINHPASLGSLGSYGGPTQTIALFTGSLAVNAGAPLTLTTLSGAATNIAGSINVPSNSALSIGQYVGIGTEIMLVTGIIGTTQVAVARAQLGTLAASHVSGSPLILAADQRGDARSATTPDIGSFEGAVAAPVAPTVAGVVLGDGVAADGATQRSEVRQIVVTFSSAVTFTGGNSNAAAAFQLQNIHDSTNINNLAAVVTTNASGQTVVTLSFTTTGNAATEIDPISAAQNVVPVPGPSLADGLFKLTVLSANVTAAGVALNGGANYVSPTDTQGGGTGQLGLYRLFGDGTGDGTVDSQDLGQFRTTYNAANGDPAYLAFMDANDDGVVDAQDLGQLRARYNASVFLTTGSGTETPAAIQAPPAVAAVAVNDGSAQRSEVRSISVTFSTAVAFNGGNANAAAAFQLEHLTDASNVVLAATVSADSQGRTVVTLTFSGAETDAVTALNGGTQSLADGRYQLTILSASVTGMSGLALNGANGNYVSPTDTSGGGAGQLHLFRLFGDVNGDGVVDAQDLGQFRSALNSRTGAPFYLSYLDEDNSGMVDAQDLGQFRSRFNTNVF